jgi:hypothetical protein
MSVSKSRSRTAAQRAASPANGRKSTGPKTLAAKRVASLNTLELGRASRPQRQIDQEIRLLLALRKNNSKRERQAHACSKEDGSAAEGRGKVDFKKVNPRNKLIIKDLIGTNPKTNPRIGDLFSQALKNKRLT